MGIRETIELEVTGREDLRSVAKELDRIAKALKTIKGEGGGPGNALAKHEQRMAQIKAKSEGRIAEISAKADVSRKHAAASTAEYIAKIEKKSAADLAKHRVAGEEKRQTARAAVDEKLRAKAVQARAKAEEKAAKAQKSAESDAHSFAKGGLMASAIETGARVALDLVVAGGRALYQAQAFREDVAGGLELILRSKSASESVMRQAASTADYIGRGRAETSGAMLDFLTKGFSQDRSDEIIKRLADLSSVDPRANLEGVQRAIGQIAGKGKLQGDELLQLAEAGLETSSVYEALSKTLDKSRADIIKMQAAGKISSDVAVQAILDAISQQTGGRGAGEVAREKSMRDLSGLMRRIEAIPSNVFFDLQVGPGVDGVKGVMRDIIEFFDAGTASGKEVRKVMADAINALVMGLTGKDLNKTTIKDTLASIVELIRNSTPAIRQWGENIAFTASAIGTLVQYASKVTGAVNAWLDFWGIDFSAKTVALMYFLEPLYAIGIIVRKIGTSFFPDAWASGAAIIDGFVAGITSRASAMATAVSNAASSAIAAGKKTLGIASPSRVFAEMGTQIPLGAERGVYRTMGRAEAASAEMANRMIGGASGFSGPANVNTAASAAAMAPVAARAAGTTGGQVVVHVTIENITIGAGAPEDGADRFIARLVDALPAALAQVA